MAVPGLNSGTWDLHGVMQNLFVVVLEFSDCGTLASIWDLSSLIRDQTHMPCIAKQVFNLCSTRDVPEGKLYLLQ